MRSGQLFVWLLKSFLELPTSQGCRDGKMEKNAVSCFGSFLRKKAGLKVNEIKMKQMCFFLGHLTIYYYCYL